MQKIKFLLSILVFSSLFSCERKNSTKENSNHNYIEDKRKNKYSVESDRDVETQDTLIQVDLSEFESIRLRIYPSFAQDHSITYSVKDRKIGFYQISQNLGRTEDYYKIPEEEREYHLYQHMKKNSSKNFHHQITREEEQMILKYWSEFKKANYQFKNVEMLDGAEFYTSIYEKDTIVYVNTNSPSSYQTKLLRTLFEVSEKYSKDSITKRNIEILKGYL